MFFFNPKAYFTGAGDYFLATFIQEEDPSLADFIYSSLNQLDAHFDAVNMSFEEALVDASASQELSSAYAVLYELHAKLVDFKKKVLKDY